ncbi:MAG: SpoIIE family protein phosphatase [Gemmatirosa sp.]|nr:SpoIIE family protein phosphatase [Gemmatirosa sp.]
MTAPRLDGRARGLESLLHAFHAATDCDVSVWRARGGDHDGVELYAAARRAPPPPPPPGGVVPTEPRTVDTPSGPVVVAPVPGVPRTALVTGPCAAPSASLDGLAELLREIVGRALSATIEVEQAAIELAERYEEINLLYTISEILGRAVTLEETASTILTEVSETVGAARASILLFDRVTGTLQAAAVLGAPPESVPPIAVDDPTSISARVFRTLHPMIADRDAPMCAAEVPYRRGEMLSVPILWSTPDGGEPLGVVNLSERRGRHAFTAGDLKLVAAIASQIAAAIQNARLVRASLQQQRLSHEMSLAHDLQMKLLPSVAAVAPAATVAARVVPAESVGGDFYHLFQLGGGRSGVMIGDVSGHGYRAALIMALAMSASAIHAQSTADPGETLGAVLNSLREELATTEMFISTLYAVVDAARGELRYANAGHPHAFVVSSAGDVTRLAATAPPLGMVDAAPATAVLPWRAGADLLLLFTDGVSDARDRYGARLGEDAVLEATRAAIADTPETVVRRVFDRLDAHVGDAPLRDDLTVLAARS